MARSSEKAVVNVEVNGAQAQKEVQELTLRLKEMRKAREDAVKVGDVKWVAAADKSIASLRKEMKQYNSSVVDVQHVLQNLYSTSLSQLNAALRQQKRELETTTRGTDEYAAALRNIRKIEAEIQSTAPKRSTPMGLEKYLGGAAILGAMERTASRAVNMYQQLDDTMADVQKTTGLTKEQVIGLDKVLQKIDTRSSREELLDLARVAGKLGINSQKDIEGFVRAADQIKVALAEDLGGNVEESIRKVGKLVEIFKLKEEMGIEKALISVGSAINSLGASSTASEEYLVEFTNRVAGIAPGMDISIQNILGLGASIDNLAQMSEVSATAYGQVMMKMRKDTSAFAKVAGMDLKEFTNLMEHDANEAFLRFLEGLGSVGATERVKMLSSLKLEGQRTAQVMGTLAGNTAKIREQQALANKEFADATSLLQEYNTKNASAAAIAEKRRKEIDRAVADLGGKLFPLWSDMLGLTGNITRAFAALAGVVVKYSGAIMALSAGVAIYVGWQKLSVFWSTANRAAMASEVELMSAASVQSGTLTLRTAALAAAKNLLAGNITAAGRALKVFFAGMGPIGWATLAVGAFVAVWSSLKKETDAAAKSAKDLADINKAASEDTAKERVYLDRLVSIASDKAESDGKRAGAIKELQRIMPASIGMINAETIATGEAKRAIDEYCKSLLVEREIREANEQYKKVLMEEADAKESREKSKKSYWSKVGSLASGSAGGGRANDQQREYAAQDAEFEARKAALKERQKELSSELAKLTNTSPDKTDLDIKGGAGGLTDPEKGKWTLEKDEKFMAAKIALRKQLTDGQIESEAECNAKLLELEIAALDARIKANVDKTAELQAIQSDLADKRYQQKKNEQARIEKLVDASLEGKEGSDYERQVAAEKRNYEKRLRDLGLFNRDRSTMTAEELAAIENLERNHIAKLQGLYMDQVDRDFSKKNAAFNREMSEMKIAHNQQIKELDTFEKKKAAIQEFMGAEAARKIRTDKQANQAIRNHYDQIEKQAAEKHLNEMLVYFEAYMVEAEKLAAESGGKLNDDEREKMLAIIDNLKKQLADLRNINDTGGPAEASKVDILGYSEKDWTDFFGRLEEGKMSIDNWKMALDVVGQAFGEISNLMAAAEQREFKEYEKTAQKKKRALDNQLKAGRISQEKYGDLVQQIDDETDRKREELERKQAARAKALNIFQAITNTAVAVTAALGSKPWGPWNIALAAMVGALGAVQVAAITAAPLPGAEDGGFLDVVREQDGKPFRAKNNPQGRGYIGGPSVIVSENGEEYVAASAAVRNPTIRPILDIIDLATKNNTVGQINLPKIMATKMSGLEGGGYVRNISAGTTSAASSKDVTRNDEVIRRATDVMQRLMQRLNDPITAEVALTGKKGFYEADQRYQNIRKEL